MSFRGSQSQPVRPGEDVQIAKVLPADYYGSTHAPTHAEESAQRRRGPKFEGLKIKTEMREDPYAEQSQKQESSIKLFKAGSDELTQGIKS